MSGVPHGGNMWKNIAIGIGTTVVAYLIVHFIFDRKDAQRERKKEREKIETTWNAVNEYMNRAKEKFTTIGCYSCEAEQMKSELLRELEQINKSLQNIKDEGGVDEKMKTIIDRTMQMFADEKPVLQSYYDSLALYKDSAGEGMIVVNRRLQQRLLEQMAHIQTRDSSDFKQYLEDLNKKYKTKLEMKPQQLEVDLKQLTGTWEIECSYTISFLSTNRFTMRKGDETLHGDWSLDGNNVELKFSDGSSLHYNMLQLTKSFMLFYLEETAVLSGGCKK